MKSKSVALVDLGESLPIRLDDLASSLNALQSGFDFTHVGTVTLEAVGDPDVDEVWYSTRLLFNVLRSLVQTNEFDLVVGITHLALARTDDNGKEIDRNYFSLSDLDKLSVVSTHQNVMLHKSPWRTDLQYVAYLVIGELLINLTRKDLMHLMANNCLFDDCVDRSRLAQCMDRSHICNACRSKLKRDNVSEKLISDVESVLGWCKKTTAKLALTYSVGHPLTAFFLGIGLGWFLQIFAVREYYLPMLIVTFSLPVFLFMRKWLSK